MFDQAFFSDQLPKRRAAFAQQHGEELAQVELLLHHGLVYRTEAEIAAEPGFVSFVYTHDHVERQAIIPYSSILAVNLTPAQQSRKRITGLAP